MEQFNSLKIPDRTAWIIADNNNIGHFCPTFCLKNITYFDFQFSNITSICTDFFLSLLRKNRHNVTHLNLANNNLKSFSNSLKKLITLETLYLSGNPIKCTCGNVWLVNWMNNFTTPSGNKIIKDYEDLICADEQWNKTAVYQLDYDRMGCSSRSFE